MNNMEKRNIVSRVNLVAIIEDLKRIYDLGFDFVDFEVKGDNNLSILLDKSYMDPELAPQFEELFEDETTPDEDGKVEAKKLTDEDLDKLS